MERVLVLEADLGVTLPLPQPLRGLEQVQNPHEPQHEEKKVFLPIKMRIVERPAVWKSTFKVSSTT